MKKLCFLWLVFFLGTGIMSAQHFSFGLKGGLNYSKLKFDDVVNIASGASTYSLKSDESFQGFHVGAFARLRLGGIYIQPELYFNTSGGRVLIEEMQDSPQPVQSVKDIRYNKLDLPVLLGIKLGPLRVNAGPVATVLLSEDNKAGDIIPDLVSLSSSATLGYQAGFGIDILKFLTLDYRYEGSLSNYGDKLKVATINYPFDSRSSMHLLSVGIMF